MLISQQHVYTRVWARGHASTGWHEGKQDKRRVTGKRIRDSDSGYEKNTGKGDRSVGPQVG